LELVKVLLLQKIGGRTNGQKHNWFVVVHERYDMIRKFTLPSQNHLKLPSFIRKNLKFEDLEKSQKD
jgi:hypothetical protein